MSNTKVHLECQYCGAVCSSRLNYKQHRSDDSNCELHRENKIIIVENKLYRCRLNTKTLLDQFELPYIILVIARVHNNGYTSRDWKAQEIKGLYASKEVSLLVNNFKGPPRFLDHVRPRFRDLYESTLYLSDCESSTVRWCLEYYQDNNEAIRTDQALYDKVKALRAAYKKFIPHWEKRIQNHYPAKDITGYQGLKSIEVDGNSLYQVKIAVRSLLKEIQSQNVVSYEGSKRD